jgi:hypothetical protein
MKISRNFAMLFGIVLGLPLVPPVTPAIGAEPVGELVPYSRPACITVRKLKLEKPELFNNCKEAHTIGLAFFNGEEYLGTNVYHVWQKTARSFKRRGDVVMVDWVKDWTNDGSDDGTKSLVLSAEKVGDDQLWHVANTSPDRHNAFILKVFYRNWPSAQMVKYVLAPGERAPIVRVNHDVGLVFVEWSRLDPE